MKLVCGLLLLIIIQYCASQQGENTNRVPGRVGKAGPRGPPGPKGEPGEVDYSVVDRRINSLSEELRALKNKVTLLQKFMHWYRAINGYYYKLFKTRRTWQQAKAACESKGSILASAGIRDSTVRLELQNYANLQTVWIGLSDIAQEGIWMWEDRVSSIGNDAGWRAASGEPNNVGGIEDCAILLNSSNDWKANDMPCGTTAAYLCEKSP